MCAAAAMEQVQYTSLQPYKYYFLQSNTLQNLAFYGRFILRYDTQKDYRHSYQREEFIDKYVPADYRKQFYDDHWDNPDIIPDDFYKYMVEIFLDHGIDDKLVLFEVAPDTPAIYKAFQNPLLTGGDLGPRGFWTAATHWTFWREISA